MRPVNTPEIIDFIRNGSDTDFDRVASSVLIHQLVTIEPRPEIWQGEIAAALNGWQAVPPVPANTLTESMLPPAEEELRHTVQRAVWRTLAPPPGRPVLLLASTGNAPPVSEVASAVSRSVAPEDLSHPIERDRVDSLAVRSWLAARQRAGTPATVIASMPLAERLAAFLERRRLIFRLPSGSRLILLGGADALEDRVPTALAASLGLTAGACSFLVALPSLTTPLRFTTDGDGRRVLQNSGHWIRYREDAGRLVVTDLATTRQPALQLTELAVAPNGDSAIGRFRLM